ncbi:MAG: metallophosphoesterase [Motiliproteus sp.]
MIQRYPANKHGRDFVCGDIHGQLTALNRELAKHYFDIGVDRLFSVGDLIDRGEQSLECLRLIKQPWFHAVRGNHEDLMLTVYRRPVSMPLQLWMQNGGDAWAGEKDFLLSNEFSEAGELAEALPYLIEVELPDGRTVGIAHAQPPCGDWKGVEDRLLQSDVLLKKTLWGNDITRAYWQGPTKNVDVTVHGHTIFPEVYCRDNAVFIDTGAGLIGSQHSLLTITSPRLTVLQLERLFDYMGTEG